jgi:hypothetical protein
LAIGSTLPFLIFWDVRTDQVRWQILHMDHGRSPVALDFSPDGRILAVATGGVISDHNGAVHLIETATGFERCRFQGHLGTVWSVAFSPDGLLLASAGNDGAPIVWDMTGRLLAAGKKVSTFVEKELDAAWSDLASEDAAKAWKAILSLSARPEQAMPLLEKRLPANAPLEPKRLARLLAELDNGEFETRDQASKDLAALGHVVAPALRKLLQGEPSVEARMRAEKLLGKIGKDGILTEELRCLRALEILEYAGTPEAKKLLENEAKGASQSQLTQGAKAALERLAKRPQK